MDKKRAIEVIEDLRDYAYDNWVDGVYDDQLSEITEAVNLIKTQISECENIGTMEIKGKKYMISEIKED